MVLLVLVVMLVSYLTLPSAAPMSLITTVPTDVGEMEKKTKKNT